MRDNFFIDSNIALYALDLNAAKKKQIALSINLQVFDSKIIAAALVAGCSILYSEDMQNGLVIDNRLTIVNPFL